MFMPWNFSYAAGLANTLLLALLGGLVVAANAPGAQMLPIGVITFALVLVAIGWGRIFSMLGRVEITPELHLLLGVALIAHVLALPVMWLGVSILVPAGLLLLGMLGFLTAKGTNAEDSGALRITLAAIAGFALIWSLEGSDRFTEFLTDGRYRLWLDGFIHAGTIAEFGEPRSMARGASGLADVPAALYHVGSHAVAGLLVRLSGINALEVIPAFWFPFGIFITVLGLFAVGRMLAGVAGAALAILGLALLPDPAAYGLRQGFLSFHWMLEASPGSLYGLPVALASLALLIRWTRQGGLGGLLLSALLLGAVFMLRAHIFVWMVVPWAVTVWLALPWPGRKPRWALLLVGSLLAVPALLWVARAEIHALGLTTFVTRHVNHLHIAYEPTAYGGLYTGLAASLGAWGALPIGLLLAFLGMGGVWFVTFLVGFAVAALRRRLELADAFPVALLFWATALMLLAPTPFHGDFTDFRQRGFVLVFAVLLTWSARFAVQLWPGLGRPLPLALGACLALLATTQWITDAKRPRMTALAQFRENELRPGLVETARWIRAQAAAQESFLISGQRPDTVWFDDATIILGTSGIPAWLSRPGLMRQSGQPRSAIAEERLERARDWQAEMDPARALAEMRAAGIGFYVTPASAPPAWDPEGLRADLRAGEMLAWRVPR